MLQVRDVVYHYAGASRPSLVEFNLDLADGEVLGLAGASESGKTTACLVVSGLAPRAIRGTLAGTILLDGEDVAAWPMHRLVAEIGIAFQNPSTQLSGVCDTVFEEVCFGPMNLGVDRAAILSRAASAIDAVGIEHLAGRDPARLSGGETQLTALAGLIALGCRTIVLDEPTAQLDPLGTRLLADALVTLAAAGTAILVAEHNTDLLARVSHRTLVLDRGRIVLHGPTKDVLSDARLPALGVPEPSGVRLLRRGAEAGLGAETIARLAEAVVEPPPAPIGGPG